MGAVACWVAAFFIVVQTGLPERATYTGYIEAGLRVAPELNAVAPPFTLPTLTGQSLRLADLRGRVVIVNFWATWCEPCKAEMPLLQSVYERYALRGVRLVAVNLGESRVTAKNWVDAAGLTFDVVLDKSQQVGATYQLRGQPSTYIISPDGIIRYIAFGTVSREAIEAAIAPFLTNG